jgi:hypothetical protein
MLRFSQLFNFLFFLWAEIDCVLDPDGRPKPNAGEELRDVVAVFRAHNVPREALAAVLLFQEAARREAATA